MLSVEHSLPMAYEVDICTAGMSDQTMVQKCVSFILQEWFVRRTNPAARDIFDFREVSNCAEISSAANTTT